MLTHSARRWIPSTAAMTGALALVMLSGPAQATGLTYLSAGHVDAIDVAFEEGAFALSVHDETVDPGVERDPASVVLVVKPEAKLAVPDDPAYAFLGAPGADVWVLPEVEDPNLLFAGLATEELEPGAFVGDSVKVRFVAICGPNGVSLFQTDPAGQPVKAVDSEDGLADVLTLPVGTHAHYNWAFEAPGTYQLSYVVSGKLAATGKTVTSGRATLTLEVQP